MDQFYEREGSLGNGASSSVVVAKRRRTGHLVALKSVNKEEIPPSMSEVDILRRSNHTNVMCAIDVLESEEFIHIAQPLMAQSLRDQLRDGALDENY